MSTTKPVHEVRVGRVRAAIWANASGQRTWFNVTFTRTYQSEPGQQKQALGFNRNDLPCVSKAAEMAYEWIWMNGTADNSAAALTARGER